jgi:hypothetical protein
MVCIRSEFESPPLRHKKRRREKTGGIPGRCFVALWFDGSMQEAYNLGFAPGITRSPLALQTLSPTTSPTMKTVILQSCNRL